MNDPAPPPSSRTQQGGRLPTRRLVLGAGASAAWVGFGGLLQRRARADDGQRFALGVASGSPRSDGMVLWTRLMGADLADAVPVRWEVAEDEAFRQIVAQGVETAEAAWAHSVHAEPRGLQPGRPYHYRFEALGTRSPAGRTRTLPAADAWEPLRFAVASCQRWEYGHYAAWADVVRSAPDLVFFLGDYIYEYPNAAGNVRGHPLGRALTLGDYRARYALYKSDPLLQAAHAAAPWVTVWDDHEVENDYAGALSSLGLPLGSQQVAAYQAYWEHLPFPKAARPRDGAMRIYGHLDWGALARILLLDDRQYRDPNACWVSLGKMRASERDCPQLRSPARSLLGAGQEAWLARSWSTAHAWNLVGQQTVMARLSARDPAEGGLYWTDGWDGYPASRDRLLGVVAERQVPGVVVLGGDMHAHFVTELHADFDRPGREPIASEFCGTSISSRGLPQSVLAGLGHWNPHLRLAESRWRGSLLGELTREGLTMSLRAVADVARPDSPVNTLARFRVEAGSARVQRA